MRCCQVAGERAGQTLELSLRFPCGPATVVDYDSRQKPVLAGRIMSGTPAVSVVVPTYNRAYCLPDTLRTVLSQSFADFELIVVDDGSTDATQATLAAQFNDPRLKYVRQDNAGVSAARNTGMRMSRGKYIAFCDSDDLWDSLKLQLQVAAMERFSSAGICWTDLTAITPDGATLHERFTRIVYRAWDRLPLNQLFESSCELSQVITDLDESTGRTGVYCGGIFSTMLVGTLISMPTVMISRAAYETTGDFDSTMAAGEDYDFNLRVCAKWPAVFIDTATIKYRVGAADQLTRPELVVDQARNSLRTVLPFLKEPSRTGLSANEISDLLADRYKWIGETELESGNLKAARSAFASSLSHRIRQPRIAAFLLVTLLPRGLTRRLRQAYQFAKRGRTGFVSD